MSWCILAPLIRWPNSLCHYIGDGINGAVGKFDIIQFGNMSPDVLIAVAERKQGDDLALQLIGKIVDNDTLCRAVTAVIRNTCTLLRVATFRYLTWINDGCGDHEFD